MYNWLDIVITAISSGTLFTGLNWLLNKKGRRAKQAKEVQDVYKTMYENLQTTILKFQDENQKLYRAVARLEKAVVKATTCRYYASCPIRGELQNTKGDDPAHEPRQLANKKNLSPPVRARPGLQGDPPDTGGGV